MKKVWKWIGIILVVAFIGIQFYRPARTNPISDERQSLFAGASVPADVQAILQRSCNDCHSNQTKWPWYSHIAPVSWFLVDHVNDGRAELSFSDWGTYPPKKAGHKLEEICELVEKGEMPLESYLIMHRDAALTEGDKQVICNWAKQERAKLNIPK